MKIVLFNDDSILRIIENAHSIVISENNVKWHDGQLNDIKVGFTVVEDEFEITDTLSLPEIDPSQFLSDEERNKLRIEELERQLSGQQSPV